MQYGIERCNKSLSYISLYGIMWVTMRDTGNVYYGVLNNIFMQNCSRLELRYFGQLCIVTSWRLVKILKLLTVLWV